MSRSQFSYSSVVLAMALLGLPGVAAADSVDHNLVKNDDTADKFSLQSGYFIGIDTDIQPPFDGLAGTASERAKVDGQFWSVELYHVVGSFEEGAGAFEGAKNTLIFAEGLHKTGPHLKDNHKDKLNDSIGPFRTARLIDKIPFGKKNKWSVFNRDKHELTGTTDAHWDNTIFRGTVQAVRASTPDPFTGNEVGYHRVASQLTSSSIVHSEKKAKKKFAIGGGIIEGSESYVSFDPFSGEMGELSIEAEIIDLLTGPAGSYEGDPLLNGSMMATFQYVGQEGDDYLFADGTLSIFDPAGEFSFDATLPSFTMNSTYEERHLENFAAIDSLTILDAGDEQIASSFLDDFFSVNYFGEGMTEAESDILVDVGLTITSSFDLVDDTSGFTQATDIPARVQIGAFLEMIPGDFNIDGAVDGNDFLAWQANFGCSFDCTLADGDADGDYDVDGNDFLIWQSNFDGSSGNGASAVPEPASVGLGLLGFLGLTVGWMRRRLG